MGRLVQLAAGTLAMHLALGSSFRSGANSDTNHSDYRDFYYFGLDDDAVCLSSVGGMDQRHTRGVAGNMLLDFGYQFLRSQSKSNRCRSAGDGIGVLRDLGRALPNEQSDLTTRLSAFQANNVRAAVFL